MTNQEENGLLRQLKKTSTVVTILTSLTFAATASFGAFWTYFLRDKVDERIDIKTGRKVDLILRIVEEMYPDAYRKAIEREKLIRQGG